MQFSDKGGGIAPKFTVQPADLLAGFGESVKLQAMASGTLPIAYQWQFNEVNLPGEVNDVLAIPAAKFEQEGTYKVIATNAFGSATSDEAQLTVGALFSELFNTGQDANLAIMAGGSVDLHYGLLESPDIANLGPHAFVWSDDAPVPVFVWNGPLSSWISSGANTSMVAGRYVYRTQFLIDSADPCTAVLEGNWLLNTTGDDILLNGQPTGITNTSELPYKVAESFTIDKGFVAGINTLDFVVSNTAATAGGYTALRVQLRGVGKALPADVPKIMTQPQSRAVRIGGKTSLSVIASGRPPLSYQWLFNDKPMTDPNAMHRTLPLNSVSAAMAGGYTVVVTNSSGSVTSDAAVVAAVPENHPPEAIPYKTTAIEDQPLDIPVSRLRWNISDPDGDPTYFTSVSPTSDAGGTIVDLGGASITYTPPFGFTGQDRFTYSIEDEGGATATADVQVEVTPK
jgi:hypothetical protein